MFWKKILMEKYRAMIIIEYCRNIEFFRIFQEISEIFYVLEFLSPNIATFARIDGLIQRNPWSFAVKKNKEFRLRPDSSETFISLGNILIVWIVVRSQLEFRQILLKRVENRLRLEVHWIHWILYFAANNEDFTEHNLWLSVHSVSELNIKWSEITGIAKRIWRTTHRMEFAIKARIIVVRRETTQKTSRLIFCIQKSIQNVYTLRYTNEYSQQ